MDLYLPNLRDELSQGDVVDLCPVGAVPALHVVRLWNGEEGKAEAKAVVYRYPVAPGVKRPPTPASFKRNPETIMFDAELIRCIVVSEDCVALAKAANKELAFKLTDRQAQSPWHIAPLRPWPVATQVVSVEGQQVPLGDLIAANRVKRYLELPPFRHENAEVVSRAYVDFRYLTPVKPEIFLSNVVRIASSSDFGRARIWAKLFSFFSGVDLPRGELVCPSCSAAHPLHEFRTADS